MMTLRQTPTQRLRPNISASLPSHLTALPSKHHLPHQGVEEGRAMEDDDEVIAPDQEIDFTTTGMFIIDEIHFLPPTPPKFNVLGGGGTYAVIGARLFSPGALSKSIGWIVDKGNDFPPDLHSSICDWGTSTWFRKSTTRETTRGWNRYETDGTRSFKYATPKLRISHKSFAQNLPLLRSKSFHLICSASRCIDLVTNILSLRRKLPNPPPKPLFIWEPVPDLCIPSELLEVTRALGFVDVISPNHDELGQLMSCQAQLEDGEVDTKFVEDATEQLLESVPLSPIAVVVRAGKKGCYVAQNGGRAEAQRSERKNKGQKPKPKKVRCGGMSLTADTDMFALFAGLLESRESDEDEDEKTAEPDWGVSAWVPAYHQDSSAVVDPTGGGNGFLGGLSIAMVRGKGLEEAARWGNVAASFMIEQTGMPVLGRHSNGEETWNGVVVDERLGEFEARCRLQDWRLS